MMKTTKMRMAIMAKKYKEKSSDCASGNYSYSVIYKSESKIHLISSEGINLVVDDFIYKILRERDKINE